MKAFVDLLLSVFFFIYLARIAEPRGEKKSWRIAGQEIVYTTLFPSKRPPNCLLIIVYRPSISHHGYHSPSMSQPHSYLRTLAATDNQKQNINVYQTKGTLMRRWSLLTLYRFAVTERVCQDGTDLGWYRKTRGRRTRTGQGSCLIYTCQRYSL